MTHPALKDRASLLALLDAWAARGWLRSLDAAFARFLADEVAEAPALLLLAAALASHQLGRGHACLDLADTLGDPGFALSLPPEGEGSETDADRPLLPVDLLEGLSLEAWRAALALPGLVGQGDGDTPLLCLGQRVYLRRYWQYEGAVASGIGRRLGAAVEGQAGVPTGRLAAALGALFPPVAGVAGPDWQKLACALAARSAFAIVTGGPGTGKTTTVVRLLAVLQTLALGGDEGKGEPEPLRIRLAAPTGKAAARLNESIAGAVAKLDLSALADGDAVRKAIPTEVTTLHRLLGSRPDSRHFRHHAGNPLGVDVLVVDEASMVDLEMMAALLDALPAEARLVLLGDKDQLASVEAGAVLGELCRRAHDGHYSPATVDWLAAVSGAAVPVELVDPAGLPLDQAVAMLRHSHRFGAASGIGQLAAAVNAGAAEKAAALFDAGLPDLARLSPGAGEAAFRRLVVEGDPAHGRAGYRTYLETLQATRPADDAGQAAFDDWARRVLKAHGSFQLLCALRRGPWGIEGLNPRIAGWLREAGLIPAAEGWYLGRPVLVTRNDYGLGLMNGDIGITLALPGPRGADVLRVAFPAGDGQDGIRWILPSRLQAVDTVYALTVHKSQGSEFVHAALALPDTLSPILTRELVYTGITRARSGFTLVDQAASGVLERAIGRQVLRVSGLMERLDQHSGEQA